MKCANKPNANFRLAVSSVSTEKNLIKFCTLVHTEVDEKEKRKAVKYRKTITILKLNKNQVKA